MLKNVPLSPQERVAFQPYEKEVVHIPHTGNLVIDQQDMLRMEENGALKQGLLQHRNWASKSWLDGQRQYDWSVRHQRRATFKAVTREMTVYR